jgi:hypothetical protein
MNSNKTTLTQREMLTLSAATFLASGLLTGLGMMLAAVAGWIRV